MPPLGFLPLFAVEVLWTILLLSAEGLVPFLINGLGVPGRRVGFGECTETLRFLLGQLLNGITAFR